MRLMLVVVQVNSVALAFILALGAVIFSVIVVEADAVHPLMLVTVTEYVPATDILLVALIVLFSQTYKPPPLAIRFMLVVVHVISVVLDVILTDGGVIF